MTDGERGEVTSGQHRALGREEGDVLGDVQVGGEGGEYVLQDWQPGSLLVPCPEHPHEGAVNGAASWGTEQEKEDHTGSQAPGIPEMQ